MRFKLISEEVIQFLVAQAALCHLLAKGSENFVNGWLSNGVFNEVGCDG